jgi:hypothetical protein
LIEESGALVGRGLLQGFQEEGCLVHWATPQRVPSLQKTVRRWGRNDPKKSPDSYSSVSPTIRRYSQARA